MIERIVSLEEKHLDKIYEIEKSCFSDPWSKNAFADSLNSHFTEIYVALDGNDDICGYLAFNIIAPDCEILNLAVDPRYRRKGVANALLDFLFDVAKKKGCEVVMLDVRESNTAAISLYEKHGFYRVGVRKGYYSSPVEDAILMDKRII